MSSFSIANQDTIVIYKLNFFCKKKPCPRTHNTFRKMAQKAHNWTTPPLKLSKLLHSLGYCFCVYHNG